MRLHILSDLHIEFGEFLLPKVEADVVVLAGDVHMGLKGMKWARKQWPDIPVVYVLGNHEFYREELPALSDRVRHLCEGTSIHFLENDSAEIAGVTFHGCTLWTDFRLLGDSESARAVADRGMADYFQINFTGENRCLEAKDTERLHIESRAWLEKQFQACSSGQTVIVTHHAPSPRSIPPWHNGSALNPAFVSDLDPVVAASGASLWIHGHTHHCVDYQIGRTRVLANQRGYPDSPIVGFNPGLVVEV